jgi:hypothetical protein
MRVRVYWNIRKKCFSVQTKEKRGWRLWLHTDQIWLDAPQFHVSQAGNARVRREGRKNVHAFIEGTEDPLIDWGMALEEFAEDSIEVTYDPYKHLWFVDRATGELVFGAQEALLTTDGGVPRVRVRWAFKPGHVSKQLAKVGS